MVCWTSLLATCDQVKWNQVARARLPGEFELIERYFAPLSRGAPGALGLVDDACTFSAPPGHELVLTTDAVVSGIHFLPGDPADRVAQKLLRVNLSDLAGKGAKPVGYLLTLGLDPAIDETWVAKFCEGLGRDQSEYNIHLLGGDTVSTPGPLFMSVTAIGTVLQGQSLRRTGAKPGDRILMTGTIGDGYLGLRVLRGDFMGIAADYRQFLVDRYQVPDARVRFGELIGARPLCHAGMDISDGLVADIGHIARASNCGAIIQAAGLPISKAAAELLAEDPDLLIDLMTSGDDYELLVTAPSDTISELQERAKVSGTRLTEIGEVVAGKVVKVVDRSGDELNIGRTGFTHF